MLVIKYHSRQSDLLSVLPA